uniref:SKA complex subunit 1 n=1 Tax=Lygus hesperus TaxID=30085 RepID=A0A0A9Y557_LYGHE
MEELCGRLDVYAVVLDVLDGVRAHPNASKDYDVVLSIINQTQEEIATLKSRLEESKQLIELQLNHSRALDSLRDRFKHISENADFYSQFLSENGDGESRLSVTPEPQDCMAHSSPYFPEPTPSISNNAFHSTLKGPEASHLQPPKTPKPVNDLEVAISYISNQDFVKIPAYMKGRLRVDDVNSFVTQFNSVLNQKLALLQKPKKSLKLKKEMDLVTEWKEQNVPSLSGQYFLSAKDFVSLINYKFSKKDFSIITILRHVQRIRETRVGKTVFYVACF